MPRVKTLPLTTLLLDRAKLPLRADDRLEHLLERFRVVFMAARVRQGLAQLQRGNLVLWVRDGLLESLELTSSLHHEVSDLVNWGDFDIHTDDILAWCAQQGIPLRVLHEEDTSQIYQTPSGALIALQDQRLWNITLSVSVI
ncbi:hypothetical protein [Deinococcus maricopensis]|uniref:Uncharacterized protein n=1 Tax=Deinococcus maricopensis (strain DSM 21211 / LMG 22137 / NRRL B-23946 / LB-34) TaxID=709986 RepID=E8U7L3_DEIML|nr:hypothetical protein [Deinococcus maricopensis]ADV67052.1 hypothetical protein Deima_1402 [Deinococcus maricopensis DSM 21211]